jgi:integrase
MSSLAVSTEVDEMQFLPFPSVATSWLESRRLHLSAETLRNYGQYIKSLSAFFGDARLHSISGDRIRAYQQARATVAGPSYVNKELCLVQQIKKRAGLPTHDYQPLPVRGDSCGRVLSEPEYRALFAAAKSKREWEAAYLFARLSVNSTCGPSEVRTLRRMDVDLERATIRVQPQGAKNQHRIRTIPLNADALDAVKEAWERAGGLGACLPEHYLFPFRLKRDQWDPTRPQRSFKKAWAQITKAAGLTGLRMYDLRHDALTKLLEDPETSEETVEAIAGHISHKMKKRYSHIRIEARRDAVNGLAASRTAVMSRHGVLTNQDVRDLLDAGLPDEVIAAKIKASECSFDTSLEMLKQLKAAGVPAPVVLAMVRTGKGGVR